MEIFPTHCYRFGSFELRPEKHQLMKGNDVVKIGVTPLRLLIALVENHQRTVPHEELIKIVWPNCVNDPNLPAVHVCTLRNLLGKDVVTTVPRVGYRLGLQVQVDGDPMQRITDPELDAIAILNSAQLNLHLTNLSAEVEPLIAREDEIRTATELVRRHRLVTLLGCGGIGKTRLAKAVAHGLTGEFADGVWWVDLAAQSDGANLALAIASAGNFQMGDGDAMQLLERAVRHRNTLLLLDNCEHLISSISSIARAIVEAGSGVHILATSQEALKVPDELVYRIGALTVPEADTPLEEAKTFGAIQLLEERVRSTNHEFKLKPTSVALAIKLCEELDGLPLAIEMAAAHVAFLGLNATVGLLGQSLRLLRAGTRDAPARQQTLRAMLEWSHSLLSPTEEVAFRRLSVFSGSFGLGPARRVLLANDLAQDLVELSALMGLVSKSLLEVHGSDPPRYRLRQTTRMFAAEHLKLADEVQSTMERYGNAMAELANEAEQAYWLTPDEPWLAQYLPDYDDFEAAFGWACDVANADVAAAIGEALRCLDGLRGVLSSVRRRKEAIHALLPVSNLRTRALLWNHLSWYSQIAIPAVPELTIAHEAVAAWRELDDRPRLYLAFGRLALACALRGDRDGTGQAQAKAREIENLDWSPRLLGAGVKLQNFVASHFGDAALCRQLSQRELQLAKQAGSRRATASARHNLADSELMAGNFEETIKLALDGVKESQVLDQPAYLGSALSQLCAASLMANDMQRARDAAGRALPLVWQRGTFGIFFNHLAWLAARTGLIEQAAKILGCADTWYASNEGKREPNEIRSAEKAGELIDCSVGYDRHKQLRMEASRLSSDRAYELAQSTLVDIKQLQ